MDAGEGGGERGRMLLFEQHFGEAKKRAFYDASLSLFTLFFEKHF